MDIVAKVGTAIQALFGSIAEEAARVSKVIVRQRKFTALSLARTFILGHMENPRASAEELAQMAVHCGIDVTPQAIAQRRTPALALFLETMFRRAVQTVVGSKKALAPILERFSEVTLLDSSTIRLPDSEQERFPGCGGSHGSGKAALKLQTELDLRSGALTITLEPGRCSDGGTSRQHVARPKGSLRISDLGYFCIAVFAALMGAGSHFLSRLQFGTGVSLGSGTALPDLLDWLSKQQGLVDVPILLGKSERLPCRLLAWRLPEEQANRRRQKLREETLRKRGYEPSAERLAWCDFTILVTSVPEALLSVQEAIILYRARWQVELLFKRWKSQGCVAELSGCTDTCQMVSLWARLLAVLVQHWLIVAGAWGDARCSLWKACAAISKFASRLAAALDRPAELARVVADACRTLATACRRNTRTKPGTFELLNDVHRLDFRLT